MFTFSLIYKKIKIQITSVQITTKLLKMLVLGLRLIKYGGLACGGGGIFELTVDASSQFK